MTEDDTPPGRLLTSAGSPERPAVAASTAWKLAVLVIVVSGTALLAAERDGSTSPAPDDELTLGAKLAQERCYALIHHDTYEYRDCLRALLATRDLTAERRLGAEYFGWAGAVNSARLGMKGADATAFEFLHRFRTTQRGLNVDDRRLCAAVAGNCDARLALLRQAETAPPPESSDDDP